MPCVRPLLLAAALLTLAGGASEAQTYSERASRAAAQGPVVLQVDPDLGRFPGRTIGTRGEDLTAIAAVPVPSVMNGGGFGLSGNNYFDDAPTEGRLDRRERVNTYILAPGRRTPPLR